MLDEEQLKAVFKATKIQNAVQRAKLPQLKVSYEDDSANIETGNPPAMDGFNVG